MTPLTKLQAESLTTVIDALATLSFLIGARRGTPEELRHNQEQHAQAVVILHQHFGITCTGYEAAQEFLKDRLAAEAAVSTKH